MNARDTSLPNGRFGLLLLLLLPLVGSGCGRFAPSAYYNAPLGELLISVCQKHGTLAGDPYDERYVSADAPNYHYRLIVVNFEGAAAAAQAAFDEARNELLRHAAAGGATIENPDSNEAESPSALDSLIFRYSTNSAGKGLLAVSVNRGYGSVLLELDDQDRLQRLLRISPVEAETYCLTVRIDESPKPR